MSFTRSKNELYAGLFLVIGVLLFGLSIWILGAERQVFASLQPFKATFQDIKGLNEGAPVRLGGIAIGRVSKIGFSPDLNDSRVHVTLLINKDFLERIREDSEVMIETQGLLGDKFLSISTGMKPKELTPGSVLKSREAGDFGAVLSKAELVVQNTVEISDTVKGLADEIRKSTIKDMTDAFHNIAAITKEIQEGDGAVHKLVYSKKDGENLVDGLAAASKSIKEITDQIKTGNGFLHALVYSPKGDETMKSLADASQKISLAAGHLSEAMEAMKTGDGLLHSIIYNKSPQNIDSIFKKLEDTANNLKIASQALAQGTGTLGALLIDSKVYDNIVEVTGDAKRSVLLRGAIRSTLNNKQ